MGQLDPLDGYVSCLEVEAAAAPLGGTAGPSLASRAADFLQMIDLQALSTADPLGLGGLLMDASLLDGLAREGAEVEAALVDRLLSAAATGVEAYVRRGGPGEPAGHRLAFREVGLAIGLQAAARMAAGEPSLGAHRRRALLQALAGHRHLAEDILSFWLEGEGARRSPGEHQDIDAVMLAAALISDECPSL
jgi:hypothetical protein